MKTKKILIVSLTGILLTLVTQTTFAEEKVFTADEHCLAYKTQKTMFFFAGVKVIGKSCEVNAEIHWNDTGEQAQVEVSAPVTSFDSGNYFRDGDIPEILRADLTPNIRFISTWQSRTDLQKMLDNQRTEVSGNLEVAGNVFPVKFDLNFNKQSGFVLIEGKLITSFSALKVEVPTVGPGGLLAKPEDYLELLVHLRSDKISGAEKLDVQK